MPFEPFSFDESVGRTAQRSARVPEGFYLVEVEDVQPTDEHYPKTTGINTSVVILESPDSLPDAGMGERLVDYSTVKYNAQFGFGQMLKALGHNDIAQALATQKPHFATYEQFRNFALNVGQRIKGIKAVVLIADQQGSQKPFSGIESWYPATDWPTKRKTRTYGAVMNGPVSTSSRPAAPAGASDASFFDDLDKAIAASAFLKR